MKFTLSWLRDHLETDAPLDRIAEALTDLGLEVEGIEDRAALFGDFVVGEVVECAPHPDADRLRVCIVDTGGARTQVVCGAPNARAGLKGVFAPAGTHVPGTGIDLKATKIRGVESSGMLLSEREMGLSDDHEGIVDLPADTPVGAPAAQVMGLDDPVIEIALTPDRADCAGVRGVARDLAAAGLGTLKPWPYAEVTAGFDSPISWARDLGDKPAACPMVVGRTFRNVRNGPSPKWLRDRLEAIGLRTISALVDITNYVTFDLGRPLHVFDADKLAGDTLTMRFARDGEKMLALDGREYALDPAMLVIADATGPQGIAGVMGGEGSGCTEGTTTVFLEVALFDPICVAETGRKLGIDSDARYRFERGVDPASALWGAEVAARLILDLCGGEASAPAIAGEMPAPRPWVALRPERVGTLGGVDVPAAESRRILDALGFETRLADGAIAARPPSWRFDIEMEACLVEEVLRVRGYHAIPVVPMQKESALSQPALSPAQRRVAFARRTLAQRGMLEAVTWSFMGRAKAALFGGGADELVLVNPISADLDTMRPSVLPNLLEAAGRNADRGSPDAALFEVGGIYHDDTPEGQETVATGVRHGSAVPRHWAVPRRAADAFDAKADALAVLEACGAPADKLQASAGAAPWYHPGRSGTLRLGKSVLAFFGEIHPRTMKALDVAGTAAAFEVFVDRVPLPRAKAEKTRPLLAASPYQPVHRDFAFVVARDTAADDIVRAARGAEKALIAGVEVFDVFEGESLGADRKSVAVTVTLQPTARTLTDEEIEAVSQRIVAAVGKRTGATLRG